jgi:NitT/TauT family transport system substrate-binding protein
MKRRSLLSSTGLFTLSLLVAAGCTNPASQMNPGAGSSPTANTSDVKLGFSAWPGWFPWQVAKEEGIFTANKVGVNLNWFDGYTESLSALNASKIDANSQTLGDTLTAVGNGSDLVIVLTNDNSTGNDKIIVSDKIKSVKDLKGKDVAVEAGTVDHFLLLQGLKKNGLTAKDIQLKPLPTADAAAAFVAGKVDAVAVFAPFTAIALKRPGSKELFSSKDFPGAISDHLVFTRKFVKEHPDRVQAVVNSWFATNDAIKANPDKATAIMAKRAGISKEEYQQFDTGTKIFTIEENLKAMQSRPEMSSLTYAADEMSKFLIEDKFIKTKPDLNALFDDKFIKSYAAQAKKS